MNYSKIYYQIISHRQNNPLVDVYTEKHHIIPKSLGGDESKENLVRLSAREHFICHLLLTKMYDIGSPAYYKMVKAFMMMLICKGNNQDRLITSKKYEKLREQHSKAQSYFQSGCKNSQYGKPKSEEQKEKIRQTLKGKPRSKQSEESKQKRLKEKHLKLEKHKEHIIFLENAYEIYSTHGFDKMVEQTGYEYTQAAFVMKCQKYLPEFVPQNGKRRKKSY